MFVPLSWAYPDATSAASSSTSYRRASTASATTACSPGRPVSTTSRAPASCSPCHRPNSAEHAADAARRRAARAAAPVSVLRWPHDHHRDLRARLRADATDHRRQPSPSGSIRHDRDHWIATTPRRSRLLLVLNRLPSRSLNCADAAINASLQPPHSATVPTINPTLLLPACHGIARAQPHRAPSHTPSASAKSP